MENTTELKLDLSVQKNIFVVEDDETTRLTITRILESDAHKVIAFSSGKSFIDYLDIHSTKPDLILLDMQLEDMTGIDCLRHIKSVPKFLNISVVMLTGEKNIELIKSTYLAGAADYLLKPIVPNLLLERVRYNFTLNFETKDIYELITRLHQEEQSLLNQSGLKEFANTGAHCYAILYKSHKLCLVFSKEVKPKNLIGASMEALTTHLRIFMRNTVRWNQIWPPRVQQDEQIGEDFIIFERT